MSRNVEYGYSHNEVTVSMEGDKAAVLTDARPQKERPVWMIESTIEGAVDEDNSMVTWTFYVLYIYYIMVSLFV